MGTMSCFSGSKVSWASSWPLISI